MSLCCCCCCCLTLPLKLLVSLSLSFCWPSILASVARMRAVCVETIHLVCEQVSEQKWIVSQISLQECLLLVSRVAACKAKAKANASAKERERERERKREGSKRKLTWFLQYVLCQYLLLHSLLLPPLYNSLDLICAASPKSTNALLPQVVARKRVVATLESEPLSLCKWRREKGKEREGRREWRNL